MERPTCKTCVFFEPARLVNRHLLSDGTVLGGDHYEAECRVDGPGRGGTPGGIWHQFPITYEHQWCGRHSDFQEYIKQFRAAGKEPPPSLDMGITNV